MAFEIPGFSMTLVAGADLSSSQYTGVKVNASGQAVTTVNGDDIIGVLQNKPTSGQAATIVTSGVSLMKAGSGGVTAGDNASCDAGGTVITSATGDSIVGVVLETGAANEFVAVHLRPGAVASA